MLDNTSMQKSTPPRLLGLVVSHTDSSSQVCAQRFAFPTSDIIQGFFWAACTAAFCGGNEHRQKQPTRRCGCRVAASRCTPRRRRSWGRSAVGEERRHPAGRLSQRWLRALEAKDIPLGGHQPASLCMQHLPTPKRNYGQCRGF